jgi:hypothetical protein
MNKSTRKRTPAQEALLSAVAMPDLLQSRYPDQWKALPPEIQRRMEKLDLTVWSDLMQEQPELFRQHPMSKMEDVAFQILLGDLEVDPLDSPPTPEDSSSSVLPV